MSLAEKDRAGVKGQELVDGILNIQRRLDMLDQRLDNIDSVVTAVAERVVNQPLTMNVTCPSCGKNIEIAIIGSKRPTI